ncbi:hypothetical protein [Clostridium sp. M14]|uniref:hypothetical protein n=1 Tax=Clostridium sp. M14 TaxID=2716311 RepID=UPI0013EE87AC|nr:hypothetical protein [Clostridium sp. M14]MBZ9693377.1 hypothetical protein [Clostridium sp. M14]
MKNKDEILRDCLIVLGELEHGVDEHLESYLKAKLTVYADILGEDIPKEYWERIDEMC